MNYDDTIAAVERIYSDKALREKMGNAAATLSNRDAGIKIYEEIVSLVSSKKR